MSSKEFYSRVEGGEIEYQNIVNSGNSEIIEEYCSTTVTGITKIQDGLQTKLAIAFYPILDFVKGFKNNPKRETILFYPSFYHQFQPSFLDETVLRNGESIYTAVRTVIDEGPNIESNISVIAKVTLPDDLVLSPLTTPETTLPVLATPFAIPGPTGSTYTLSWNPVQDAFEYKVYRIPKDFIDSCKQNGEID